MKVRIINKPTRWDKRSLALATKDELVADILIRQKIIKRIGDTEKLIGQMTINKQKQWIEVIKDELTSRYVIEVE